MKKLLSPALPSFMLLLPLLLACATSAANGAEAPAATRAARQIDGARLLEHIKVLASDRFEGRSPGTAGEQLTIDYLRQQFIKIGLRPGNPNGSYLQPVPLASVVSKPQMSFSTGAKSTALTFPDDYVAWASRREPQLQLQDSELVFVGYGVKAPEFQWDDYKGTDLRGKTLLMLINDPAIPDPKNPARLDPAMFGGKAMTYYGRWTYKFEQAARLGAAGALIIHDSKAAAYPYEVVRNSWGRDNFSIKGEGSDPGNPDFPPLSGWIQQERARDMFRSVALDFDALKKAALTPGFKPVPLGVKLNASADNTWTDVPSNNVVALLEGSDPLLKNEYIVYSAHWDHLGVDTSLPGNRSQQTYHGAQDNASGVAALLEVAKAYKALPKAPKRSILFLITTGEERGLLGAQYYARHPLYPLNKTVLNINVDVLNVMGRTRDIEIVGYGKSSTDELVVRHAKLQKRLAGIDTLPEAGRFYRSDQFEFAKKGVPVIYLKGGKDFLGKPPGYGAQQSAAYIAHDYHKVSDTVRPDWDLRGAVQDSQLLFYIGYDVAQGKQYPQWKPGAEFKAARDAATR